jgi:16S rRNA (uracil1498-N3)-methyltransferase
VRVPIAGLSSGERTLDPNASRHLARVLRLSSGSSFVAFDPRAAVEADARIVDVVRGVVRAHVGPLRPGRSIAEREVVWLQGIAKADKLDAIVRDATELGATRIVPFLSRHAVVKIDDRNRASKHARWQRIASEAARQSGRAEAPVVDAPQSFDEAIAGVDAGHARILLFERGADPLGPMLKSVLDGNVPLAVAAGAEGGFADEEIAQARASGWQVASLGDSILRAETVASAVLGAIRIWGTIPR